jgi:hypothetical protein
VVPAVRGKGEKGDSTVERWGRRGVPLRHGPGRGENGPRWAGLEEKRGKKRKPPLWTPFPFNKTEKDVGGFPKIIKGLKIHKKYVKLSL